MQFLSWTPYPNGISLAKWHNEQTIYLSTHDKFKQRYPERQGNLLWTCSQKNADRKLWRGSPESDTTRTSRNSAPGWVSDSGFTRNDLPGKPDVVLARFRAGMFVHAVSGMDTIAKEVV
jgi:hypothetical protein